MASFAANFEVEKRASLDARAIVDTKADLLLLNTWKAHDWNEWTYVGMVVAVADDWANSGLYMLAWVDYTDANNRKKIGDGGVVILTDTVTSIQYELVVQNWNLGIEPV